MDLDLKKTVASLLQPLIRYLIGRGITYPALCILLKEVYVEEAVRRHDGTAPLTDSRVSLLTGIHRKEIRRLREIAETPEPTTPARATTSVAVRLIAEWVTNRRFLDTRRRPRVLPLRASGKQPSFEALAETVKADMRPAAVLDELLRVGVATLENEQVRLLKTAYVPALPADKLAFLGANVGDHLRSALHNLDADQDAYLERAVYYGLVEADALATQRPHLVRLAERFLREVNSLAMPLNDAAQRHPPADGRRMRLGVYYYEEKVPPHNVRRKTRPSK